MAEGYNTEVESLIVQIEEALSIWGLLEGEDQQKFASIINQKVDTLSSVAHDPNPNPYGVLRLLLKVKEKFAAGACDLDIVKAAISKHVENLVSGAELKDSTGAKAQHQTHGQVPSVQTDTQPSNTQAPGRTTPRIHYLHTSAADTAISGSQAQAQHGVLPAYKKHALESLRKGNTNYLIPAENGKWNLVFNHHSRTATVANIQGIRKAIFSMDNVTAAYYQGRKLMLESSFQGDSIYMVFRTAKDTLDTVKILKQEILRPVVKVEAHEIDELFARDIQS